MLPLGTKAPNFVLPDTVSGNAMSLNDVKGEAGLVVMFLCNHCPFVKHVNAGIVSLANDYADSGMGFVAISSNDVENYPDDSPDKMKEVAATEGYSFPYLYDESQDVARVYDAACTPDFYVFDREMLLVYRGRMDASRPGNDIPVTGEDLRNAIDAALVNRPAASKQYPSAGCGIKWREM